MAAREMSVKPPWLHARIVKACTELTSMEKLIWLEHYGLTNGASGAFVSANALAHRIAVSKVSVERARQRFFELDLITKRNRGPGRTASWFVQLPSCARPSATRLNDDEVERYAELLEEWIKSQIARELNQIGVTSNPPTTLTDE